MSLHRNKNLNIQALRGIAVVLVIAFHLQGNEEKYFHGYTILPDFLTIGSSGVDLFFVISGFMMVAITSGRFQKTGAIYQFLYHRVTRIYPMYWFYSILMLIIYLIQVKTGNNTRIVDITSSFLLLPQDNLPLLVVGWTLVHEVYFYVVFSILLAFHERWLLALLVTWGLALISASLIPYVNATIKLISNPLTLEFIFGCIVALIHFTKKPSLEFAKYLGWPLLSISFIGWLLAYSICMRNGFQPVSSDWSRIFVFGIPSTIFLYALVTIEKSSSWRLPNWLISIGDASFSIYLSHLLIIAAIGRIWQQLGMSGIWANAAVLTAMFFAVLAIGMASFRFMERPLLKFTRSFE